MPKKSKPSADKHYEVRWTVTVDRPELRDTTAGYPTVPPGKKLPQTSYFATQGQAVTFFNSLIAGREDYSSEHVTSAQVVHAAPGKKVRSIRKWTTRARAETRSMAQLRTLAVGAKRRGALHTVIYGRDDAINMGAYYNKKQAAAKLEREIEAELGIKL